MTMLEPTAFSPEQQNLSENDLLLNHAVSGAERPSPQFSFAAGTASGTFVDDPVPCSRFDFRRLDLAFASAAHCGPHNLRAKSAATCRQSTYRFASPHVEGLGTPNGAGTSQRYASETAIAQAVPATQDWVEGHYAVGSFRPKSIDAAGPTKGPRLTGCLVRKQEKPRILRIFMVFRAIGLRSDECRSA
jgi:hypothetical protein